MQSYYVGLLYRHGLPWVPVLLFLLLFCLKRNRHRGAWTILIPMIAFWGVAEGVGRLFGRTIFHELHSHLYTVTMHSFVIGFAGLWATSYVLKRKSRFLNLLGGLLIMTTMAGIAALFLGQFKWIFMGGGAGLTGAAACVLLPSMALAAWRCHGQYRPVRFMLWLLPLCILLATLWVYPYDKAISCAIRWTARAYGFHVSNWQWFHNILFGSILGIELGMGAYIMALPFLLFAFFSRFYRERLQSVFRLEPRAPEKPEAAGVSKTKVLVTTVCVVFSLLLGSGITFRNAALSQKEAPVAPGDVVVQLEPMQPIFPSIVNYYSPQRLQLSRWPQEALKALPELQSKKPLYGVLEVGTGPDRKITVLLDEKEGEEPRIYVDLNNDENLTNDGLGQWSRDSGSTLGLSVVSIQVDYASGPLPYHFDFYRFTDRLRDFLLYYRNAGRQGEAELDGETYQVMVIDENADGQFDDLANGTLLVDLNQNGKLEGNSDSAEHYEIRNPFNVRGKVWEVVSVSPEGTRLHLRPSLYSVPEKRYLDEGYAAVPFVAAGLHDETIDLQEEAKDTKLLLLDFWASWCGPCRAEFPHLKKLHAQYGNKGLKIIGVNLDSDREAALKAAQESGLDYPHVFDGKGWSSEIAALYRVRGIPATFLMDKDLNIVAKGLRGDALELKAKELLGEGEALNKAWTPMP